MFSDFLTPTQLSNEEMYLNNLACPQMPEPAGCTVGVLTWWRQIAPLIFSEDATYKICKSLNSECSTTRHVLITNFIVIIELKNSRSQCISFSYIL